MDRPVVLLDRDGTINVEVEYLAEPARVTLLPNAAEGLRRLQAAGLKLVVISNQSGVGRGYFSEADLEAVNRRLLELLEDEEVTIDGVYCCIHSPEAGCGCRKPAPGLVRQAAKECGFDPSNGFVIGDKAADVELGRRVGARSILVLTGYGSWTLAQNGVAPDFTAVDLLHASQLISQLKKSRATCF